jgi:hypothetical protein
MFQAESNFDPEAESPVGALGIGQLMPGTARGLGVDPRNWKQNIQGSVRYLKTQFDKFGSMPLALSAYNSGPGGSESSGRIEGFKETQAYVAKVTELEKMYRQFAPPEAQAAAGVVSPLPAASTPSLRLMPTTPAASAPYLSALLKLGPLSGRVAGQAAKFTPRRPLAQPQNQYSASGEAQFSEGQGQTDDWRNWVGTIKRREGPSAPHTPEILQFVGRIGRRANTVLTPWGNESHSLTTVNGRPSAHGTGHAADIPARGDELIRLGRMALIEAGADPEWAMKQKGGLFNIGGYQVIFATKEGGNHYDHVHVGIRGDYSRRGGR